MQDNRIHFMTGTVTPPEAELFSAIGTMVLIEWEANAVRRVQQKNNS